jgi:hypothetical protein
MLRPSILVLALLAVLVLTFLAVLLLSVTPCVADRTRLEANRLLARRLELTDLALFTEARYTRHPTQADLHSAFQDALSALEHFPTGALMPPPLAGSYGQGAEVRAGEFPAPDAEQHSHRPAQ